MVIAMLMSTHLKIAELIGEELEISSKKLISRLKKGSCEPDRWKDFPHHYGKDREIRRHIVEARNLFLHGAEDDAFFQLGVALHYVQDAWVTIPGSHPLHGAWEGDIDDAAITDDLTGLVRDAMLNHFADGLAGLVFSDIPDEYVKASERQYLSIIKYTEQFEEMRRSDFDGYDGSFVRDKTLFIATLKHPILGSPILDLNFAYKISLMVSSAVCTSKESRDFKTEIEEKRRIYMDKLERAEELYAAKLSEMNMRKIELEQKKGFINKLRKMACAYNFWFYKRAYNSRKHLKKVQKAYEREAEEVADLYEQWYLTYIPPLNIEKIERLFKPKNAH